jgi:two-component sensor histidine kinase
LVDPVVKGTTFSAYYPFVLLASLFLSWPYAAAVAAASAIVGNYLFVEPRFTFFPSVGERFGAVLFMISATLVLALGNTLRRNVLELHDARAREAHLNRELQHRVKNTLAVVQGLVTQTFRDLPESKPALIKLQGRLRALADANDILRDGHWDGCSLPDLAVRALAPFNDTGAINLVGPECNLPEGSCVPLVLALHELATNAVKYGALSKDCGTVGLSWQACDHGTAIILSWVERGGPPVMQPTHRGLGSKLLRPQAGLEAVALNFEVEGVRALMTVAGATLADPADLNRIAVPPAAMHSTGGV